MTFKATVGRTGYDDLWYYHLIVPQEAAEPFLEGNRRVVCTLAKVEQFHCALISDGKGGWLITLNDKRRNKLGLSLGQEVEAQLEKDTSKYGLPMPEELREVMDQDPEGDTFFHALTPGKQRSLIYWVGNVKSSNIKIRRALVLMEHLKAQQGKLNSDLLMQELKQANQQGF